MENCNINLFWFGQVEEEEWSKGKGIGGGWVWGMEVGGAVQGFRRMMKKKG